MLGQGGPDAWLIPLGEARTSFHFLVSFSRTIPGWLVLFLVVRGRNIDVCGTTFASVL